MIKHDGCKDCEYEELNEDSMPCVKCKGTVNYNTVEYDKRRDFYVSRGEKVMNKETCDANYGVNETPEETINRLNFLLKCAEEDRNYYMKKYDQNEHLLHNILQLLSNPYLKIGSMEE